MRTRLHAAAMGRKGKGSPGRPTPAHPMSVASCPVCSQKRPDSRDTPATWTKSWVLMLCRGRQGHRHGGGQQRLAVLHAGGEGLGAAAVAGAPARPLRQPRPNLEAARAQAAPEEQGHLGGEGGAPAVLLLCHHAAAGLASIAAAVLPCRRGAGAASTGLGRGLARSGCCRGCSGACPAGEHRRHRRARGGGCCRKRAGC